MEKQRVVNLEIIPQGDIVICNIVFPDLGEIRQKRRSKEWVMKRIFQSELKTWSKRWGETLDMLEEE